MRSSNASAVVGPGVVLLVQLLRMRVAAVVQADILASLQQQRR
jgi:hypothetical protein